MTVSFLKKSLFLFLLILAALSSVFAQVDKEKSRDERWLEDINFYASELPKRHKNLFFHLPQKQFEKEVSQIKNNVSNLSDDEITVALITLTAKIGDAHTTVWQSEKNFRTFPVSVFLFKEGWYVLGADEKYKEILGTKLVKVENTPIDEVMKKVSEVIAAENKYWLWSNLNSDFQTAEILQAKGIIRNKETATFTFLGRDGKEFSTKINSVAPQDLSNIKPARFADQIETPLANQNSKSFYWFKYLPDSKTLFIAYNRCVEEEGKPFAKFVEDAFTVADREKAEKIVVDLRRNGGGNSAIMRPLIEALKARPQMTEKGKLFVLMGRNTFSSGFMNARELKVYNNALWIGEPSGQNPNAYGEVKSFELPNFKLKINYSTKFFELATGETRGFLPVNVEVDRTFKDFAAGRDVTLETALDYKK